MNIFTCPLPPSWTRTSISSQYRVTKKPRDLKIDGEQKLPFIPMELVPAGGQTGCKFELRKFDAITSGMYFEAGDVLLSKITPSFENGKQGLANDLPGKFGYGSTELIPLQALTKDAVNLYLFYLLLQHEVRDSLTSKMEGSTGRQRVPEGAVRELEIPFPPRTEQEKIAAILWKLQRAIATQDRLIATTRDLKQSAMYRLFTCGVRGEQQKETEIGSMPENWAAVQLGNVSTLSTGTTPATKEAHYYDGDVPFIKTVDVVNNRITSASTHLSQAAIDAYSLKLFPPGTVLMAMYGQGKTRGQVALLEIAAATTQNAGAIQPSSEIDSAFLWHYLLSCYERLRGMGSLGHVSHLNLGYLRDLVIVKPPLDQQREIAAILDAIDRKLAHHQKKRAALNDLFQTLLHKLMTGEIRVADIDIDASEITAATGAHA